MRARLVRLLTWLAALSLVWACAVWLTGGFAFTALGTSVTSYNTWRPTIVGGLALGALLWLEGPRGTLRRIENVGRQLSAARLSAGLACVVFLVGVRFGTWTASGPDPFAYLSQATLWQTGRLEVPVPLARDAPWPKPVETFMPWGYRPAPGGAAVLVPTYAPGLPMLMAAAQRLGGFAAAFLITPIAGAALVWLTFSIGRHTRSASTGLIASWLVATSPAFLFMLMWPMTDVPAAACAALVIWLLLRSSSRAAAAAGLVASAGLLFRLTFTVLACGVVVWLTIELLRRGRRTDRWRLPAFGLGLVPGIVVTAATNGRWYGSPFRSGYGSMGDVLAVSHVGPNILLYSRRLMDTSPLAIAGIVALLWFVARARKPAVDHAFLLLAIVTATAWLPYLFYESFDDWWYLRFLLPAWPAMFVAVAAALDGMRTRGRLLGTFLIVVVLGAGIAGVWVSQRRGVFALNERHYATVARLVASVTNPSAVILTVQHSGTIRFYGGRQTLRWDELDPGWLDRTLAWLSAQGRHPYLLIEDGEELRFEARFAGANQNGRLSFSPALAWKPVRGGGWMFLFDPLARGAVTWHPGPEVEDAEPFCARPAADPWPK